MVVQNKSKEQYRQFKYYFTKDRPELTKQNTKLLHYLWRITYQPNENHHVTGIAWSPKYSDLFATAYGSYDFGKKLINNTIALFSLKNTEFPEKIIHLETAA